MPANFPEGNTTYTAKWTSSHTNANLANRNDNGNFLCLSCNRELLKTGEVTVIPAGETATVYKTDDSSWSGYLPIDRAQNRNLLKGVFIKDRKVTLSPFVLAKYEVTQELFEKVMGVNPSFFGSAVSDGEKQELRPVETLTWYRVIAFCNKLSLLVGLEPCYIVSGVSDWAALEYDFIPTSTDADWDAVTWDFTKNGYRLPTEAEWEFAARGGDPEKTEWGYAFAGFDFAEGNKLITEYNKLFSGVDENLEKCAWCKQNSRGKTHEVGIKQPNSLGLYDMSGNVCELCWDWYDTEVSTEAVTDPKGPDSGTKHLWRGGFYNGEDETCVSVRNGKSNGRGAWGIRLARSL